MHSYVAAVQKYMAVKDTFEIKVGEKPITIKTTNWTEQASGSCLVSIGRNTSFGDRCFVATFKARH